MFALGFIRGAFFGASLVILSKLLKKKICNKKTSTNNLNRK